MQGNLPEKQMSVSLRERLMTNDAAASDAAFARESAAIGSALQQLKTRLHQTILDRIDLERLQRLAPERVRDELRSADGEAARRRSRSP